MEKISCQTVSIHHHESKFPGPPSSTYIYINQSKRNLSKLLAAVSQEQKLNLPLALRHLQ